MKNRIKALVVENDKDMCELLSDVLKKEGHRVNVAYDGRTALQMLKDQAYDVMILDYNLWGTNGLIVFKKALQIKPSISTIMISASTDEVVKKKAQKLGIYDFFGKPFNIDELLKVVEKAFKEQQEAILSRKQSPSRACREIYPSINSGLVLNEVEGLKKGGD